MAIGVYFIKNLVNGKVYVGSSLSIKKRLSTHRTKLSKGKHPNEYLQRAHSLNGAEQFEFGILEECDAETRLVREQWWIDHLKSGDEAHGYNLIPTRESQLYGDALSVHQRKGWAALSKDERREIAGHLLDPEMKKKAQAAANAARATPQHSAIRREIAARTVATEATRRKNSERLKRLWQDPEFRAKKLADLARGRDKTNARLKTDPEFRQRTMATFENGRKQAKANADRRKALRDEIVSSAAN